jgi:hypothetical protein
LIDDSGFDWGSSDALLCLHSNLRSSVPCGTEHRFSLGRTAPIGTALPATPEISKLTAKKPIVRFGFGGLYLNRECLWYRKGKLVVRNSQSAPS